MLASDDLSPVSPVFGREWTGVTVQACASGGAALQRCSRMEANRYPNGGEDMKTHPKLVNGQIVLQGVGQELVGGRWGSRCIVTEHLGQAVDEHILEVPGTFATEEEAISAGLHRGMAWVHDTYPLD